MLTIPASIKPLLWDINTLTLDAQKHAVYLIERVLEFGTKENYRWLKEQFGKDTIITVIKSSKRISAKTATFASLLFNIPKEEIACFQKPYTQKQHRF